MNETTYAFAEDYEICPVPVHHYIVSERMSDWGLPNRAYFQEVDPETVCQYTGLADRSGKKIFEGDIVSCAEYECCGYIAWNESEAGFYFQVLLEDGDYEEEQLYDYADKLEAIGNIFDNPTLLEGGAE